MSSSPMCSRIPSVGAWRCRTRIPSLLERCRAISASPGSSLFADARFRRTGDHLLQHLGVDIADARNIDATLTGLVLAKFRQKLFLRCAAAQAIYADRILARTETDRAGFTFASTLVFVAMYAESDDAAAPHLCRSLRGFRHQCSQRNAIDAARFRLDRGQESLDAGIGGLCLV